MDHQMLRMSQKFIMKLCSAQLLLPVYVIVCLLPLACADLNSDKQALMTFVDAVPHGPKLQWDNATNICTSWFGVTCTSDGTRVVTLRLPAAGLTGPIPPNTLGELDALRVLSLRSNLLNGSLPSDILSLPSLRSLFLHRNNFTGNIPDFLPRRLHILDLSYNSFTGEIPATIQFLTRLTGLYLQNNCLSGPIPNVTFTKLKHFNISNNHLNGSIPSFFKALPTSSFLGNPLLCGLPLRSCTLLPPPPPPPPPTPTTKFSSRAIIAIAVGGGVAALILVCILVSCCFKKEGNEASRAERGKSSTTRSGPKSRGEADSGVLESDNNKLVFFQDSSYNFDLEELLRASAEVLGKGCFGTAYKAVLEESTTVVVKRLKEVAGVKKDFELQMEMIERVGHHKNVAPLCAYYYSKDEKLLVYDYYEGGSLMALLHGNTGAGRTPVDWETRVKIVIGAGRGIAHIHATGGPKFIHGNIKSSNVLINHEMDGVISDTGLVQLTNSGSSGYGAPEVEEARKFSQKSDVYSFGILLLEMLTGKQPVQSPGRGGEMVDLPRWVQSVVREEWTSEVFDIELMRFHNIEEEMVQVLQIGLACVVRAPENRPTIHAAVSMLEQIRLCEFENRPPSD